MKYSPENINISSDSSSEDKSPFETYVPPFRPPLLLIMVVEPRSKPKRESMISLFSKIYCI
jgi:hypothetical protein